nr:hypothetical protein CFP56_36479 [Quercus suber]
MLQMRSRPRALIDGKNRPRDISRLKVTLFSHWTVLNLGCAYLVSAEAEGVIALPAATRNLATYSRATMREESADLGFEKVMGSNGRQGMGPKINACDVSFPGYGVEPDNKTTSH